MALQLDLDATLCGTGYTATVTDAGTVAIASDASIGSGNARQIICKLTNVADAGYATLSIGNHFSEPCTGSAPRRIAPDPPKCDASCALVAAFSPEESGF